jgi:hypothetical protein
MLEYFAANKFILVLDVPKDSMISPTSKVVVLYDSGIVRAKLLNRSIITLVRN